MKLTNVSIRIQKQLDQIGLRQALTSCWKTFSMGFLQPAIFQTQRVWKDVLLWKFLKSFGILNIPFASWNTVNHHFSNTNSSIMNWTLLELVLIKSNFHANYWPEKV